MRLAFALVSLLVAACAPMEWYRPDMGAAETEDDQHQCADQAWRATSWNYVYAPATYWGPFGRGYWGPYASPYNDRFMEEARLADYCMQAKGYRLEPTTK
jgi:hypothetical protein